MSRASLCYVSRDNDHGNLSNQLILESGTLAYIDNCTRGFENQESLINYSRYMERIDDFQNRNRGNGEITIIYITNEDRKKQLKPIYNDPVIISTRGEFYNGVQPEIELARKKIFNSKNQYFAKLFLNDESLADTFKFRIKISRAEYNACIKLGMIPLELSGNYYLFGDDIIRFRTENTKLGSLRDLVEDCLDEWKRRILSLKEEELYYYSRQLRNIAKTYDEIKLERKKVINLNIKKSLREKKYRLVRRRSLKLPDRIKSKIITDIPNAA